MEDKKVFPINIDWGKDGQPACGCKFYLQPCNKHSPPKVEEKVKKETRWKRFKRILANYFS